MSPVPLLRPREVVAAFERLGWEVARQRSSHIIDDETGAYRHTVDSEPPPSCQRNATQFDCEGGFEVGRISGATLNTGFGRKIAVWFDFPKSKNGDAPPGPDLSGQA